RVLQFVDLGGGGCGAHQAGDMAEQVLDQMKLSRRYLAKVHPRGHSASTTWEDGELKLPSHD
ncbi:MAG TPA: hypothetical protein VF669_14935, partial [Tepidisphaeraceae bacterium]